MRPSGPASKIEARRKRALELLDKGLNLSEAGRRVGAAASSVMRWRKARAGGGEAALRVRPSPGRPARLTPEQRRELVRLLLRGPRGEGPPQGRWTAPAIADLIRGRFGISYHRDHIGRLLEGLGVRERIRSQRPLVRLARAVRARRGSGRERK